MYSNTARVKIIGAFMVGAACVVLALMFKGDGTSSATTNSDAVVVVDAPDREAVPVTDSNQDGVPDWQEALQRTEPLALSASSSEYTPPETLTDQFALEFFEQMVRSDNQGAFGASPEDIVNASSEALLAQAIDTPITEADIIISDDASLAAQARYGEEVARIINTYSETSGENEAQILEQALQVQSAEILERLDPKIQAYQDFFTYTKEIAVPAPLVPYHLALLTVYQAQVNNITAMRDAFTDPMLALVRLKRYQEDANDLNTTIVSLYTALIENGVTWENNSVVYTLISTP